MLTLKHICRASKAAVLETGEVEDTSCMLANASYAGRILRRGEGHLKPTADQCWQACR